MLDWTGFIHVVRACQSVHLQTVLCVEETTLLDKTIRMTYSP